MLVSTSHLKSGHDHCHGAATNATNFDVHAAYWHVPNKLLLIVSASLCDCALRGQNGMHVQPIKKAFYQTWGIAQQVHLAMPCCVSATTETIFGQQLSSPYTSAIHCKLFVSV